MQQDKYFIKDEIKDKRLDLKVNKSYLEQDFHIHQHDYTEMLIVLGGTARHTVEKTSYMLRPGDICVIKPSVYHGFCNVNRFRHCNIMFDAERVFSGAKGLSLMPGFQILFSIEMNMAREEAYKSMIRLDVADIPYVDKITDRMLAEAGHKQPGYDVLVRAMFLELAVFCARKYSPEQSDVPANITNLVQTVIYMEEHFKENLTLGKLSEISCLSPRHFDRIFRRVYKTTPLSYIFSLRMDHACYLLENTDLPVAEIARASGFTDGNYFARVFRKHKGISPVAYRKLRPFV